MDRTAAHVNNYHFGLSHLENFTMPVPSTITSRLFIALGLAASFLLSPFAAAAPTVGEKQVFVEKQYDIQGDWSIMEVDGTTLIRFSDDFKTEGGPDLKVFLSPTTIDEASGENATDGSVLLGNLVSTEGTQDYALPAGLSLADFRSVVVHCERFSVLWGGGAL